MNIKKILTAAAVMLTALLLSGCMTQSAEDLYSLPQLSDEYFSLQKKINSELDSGAEYSAPTSGSYRQAVQFEDIDFDGVDEALVFLSASGDDKPLKVCIFKYMNDDYEKIITLEGEGTSIDCIDYSDLDGNGVKEVIVGWQISSGINLMTVYTINNFNAIAVLNTNYTEFIIKEMTGDHHSDIFILRLFSSELTGEAQVYSMRQDGEIVNSLARLTNGVETISRVRSSSLYTKEPAVFVESVINGTGITTDIFACIDGILTNITMVPDSIGTMRTYSVYCRDMNGDGSLDVPNPVSLVGQSDTSAYYVIEWYGYKTDGSRLRVMSTYVNYSDGWYLVIPEGWMSKFTVRREDSPSGERAIVFSKILKTETLEGQENAPEIATEVLDILRVYAFTDDNRLEKATIGERFILKDDGDTTYAAELLEGSETSGFLISRELVEKNFNLLYSEWMTGET